MNKKLKVGLLGAGYIIDSHAKALRALPNVEIVAVCDRAIQRAEDAAKTYAIPHVFGDLGEMLKLKLDVVHVLLPPDLHINATRQILEADTSAFLEKPMGLDAAECQLLVNLATERNLKLAVNHNFLFLPAYEALRKQVADGTIGHLDQITINWLYTLGLIQFGPFNNWMLREPQNLWFELGPHLTAFMLDLLGTVDEISTHVSRSIDLPGGSRVYRKWHIHGTKGNTSIDLNMSVTLGYTDRSISVRGHAATAKCDFDRDIYYRDEPSGHGMLLDSFMTNVSVAGQLGLNALKNLVKSVQHTLKKSPEANPFGISIARSVKAFYDTFEGTLDPRLEGQFGVNVIAACERITQQANFDMPHASRQVWAVLPPSKKPTILVIGGTGFIGKYLVKKLTEQGHGVRVVTRGISAGNIGLAGLPVELIQGDIAEAAFMDKALEGIEVVYDLAKAAGSKWEDYYKNDVLVTKNIAERAQAHGVKQFIYTGTIDSYYSADANSVITADTPLDQKMKNRNLYAKSKATCEALLLDMHKQSGFPVTIFRPGVVIGKGCPPAHWGVGMFQSESRVQFWGDGSNKLPLVLVEDVADALVLALDKAGIAGETFLLTDAPLLSGRDYVDIVSKESGTKLRATPTPIWKFFIIDAFKEGAKNLIKHPNRKMPSYRDWDSRSHRAQYDSTKTKDILGWQPAGTKAKLIENGIVSAVREFSK
jgi:nucleoside-diphosphate-sugar epimerase/predicted dehydrogenase